jgi:5-formyltetrahydrofolate cyclo-ligase
VVEFDPAALGELRSRAKRQIRRRMRGVRLAISTSALELRSQRIARELEALSLFRSARSVALFWPMEEKHEVDLRSLDSAARAADKTLYYPFMEKTEAGFLTGFRRSDDASRLEERGQRFAEPPPDAPVAARGDIDLVVVPALAAAADGHRIGYGAGYYDATLPDVCPPARSVVVVFDFQLLAELPSDEHDVSCDVVLTDARVIDARGVLAS